jgi:hypothetical protein
LKGPVVVMVETIMAMVDGMREVMKGDGSVMMGMMGMDVRSTMGAINVDTEAIGMWMNMSKGVRSMGDVVNLGMKVVVGRKIIGDDMRVTMELSGLGMVKIAVWTIISSDVKR